jgi:phosphopentomutase
VLRRNWIGTNTSAATHGSAHWYDQHVPVIFMGPAFKPGRYATPASPADLAPTLASLIRLAMPDIDGRVLTNAMR